MIVPVYRHWELVPALLEALAAQDRRRGRRDPAGRQRPRGRPRRCPAPCPNARILPCAAPGAYAARNVGIAAARGRLLAFTDADCRPDPGWLAALRRGGEDARTLLAGPVRIDDRRRPVPNRWEAYELLRGIPQERYVRLGYAATANLTVPAAVFAAIGGFDAARRSGGDAAFCRRVGRRGYADHGWSPGAVVAHPARASWEALARQGPAGQGRADPRRRAGLRARAGCCAP